MPDLKVLRAYLRLSQADLAREIGIDRRRISEIENGERSLRPPEAERVRNLLTRTVRRPHSNILLLAGLDGAEQSE